MSAGTEPPESTGLPERPLTPDEALQKLFMDNADHDRNAANDELIAALLERARQIQALADAGTPCPTLRSRGSRR